MSTQPNAFDMKETIEFYSVVFPNCISLAAGWIPDKPYCFVTKTKASDVIYCDTVQLANKNCMNKNTHMMFSSM